MGTLNGMFEAAYNRPIQDYVAQDLKTTYSLWGPNDWNMRNGSKITNHGTDLVGLVHPLTLQKLKEGITRLTKEPNMAFSDSTESVVETPLQRELNQRKYQVRELRESISRKKEELRIALALLNVVKKLKGAK